MQSRTTKQALNTTINTTPLVDVMLVLLIIFLVTIPVVVKTGAGHPADLSQYRHGDQAGEYRDRGRPGREHLLEQRDHVADRHAQPASIG